MRIAALCLALILIFPAASAQMYLSDENNWPMFLHDASHTGVSNSSAPENANIKWTFRTHGEIKSSATVLDGIAFFGSSDGYAYAVFSSNGTEKWRFKTCDLVESTPTPAGDKLLFGSYDGKLYCLWRDNGTECWNFSTTKRIRSSPVVVDNIVYFGSYDYNIYAVNFSDGSLKWKFATNFSVGASALVRDGIVYMGSHDGFMYALRAADGALAWRLDCRSGIQSSATYGNGRLYFGSNEGKLFCVLPDGMPQWDFSASDRIVSSPAFWNDKLYFGSWDSNIYCVNDTGKLVWKFTTGAAIFGSVTIAGGKALAGSTDRCMYAIDANDGALSWSYQTRGMIRATPTVVNNTAIIGSHDGYMYAFDTSPPPQGSAVFSHAGRTKLAEFGIPKNATIDNATIELDFHSYTSGFLDYPTSPSLYFSDEESPFWAYDRAGYGSMGYQYEDHLGQESIDLSFSKSGTQSTYVVIPKNATIERAELRISNAHYPMQQSVQSKYALGSTPVVSIAYYEGRMLAGCENGSIYEVNATANTTEELTSFSGSVQDMISCEESGKLLVLLNDRLIAIEGFFSSINTISLLPGEDAYRIAKGDLDDDGDSDAAICTSRGLVFFENINGTFFRRNATVINDDSSLNEHYTSIGLENIDCDGPCDVVVAGESSVRALVGLGNWSFSVRTIRQIQNLVYAISFVDYDGEGSPDLLLGMSNGYVYCCRNLGNGTFDQYPTVLYGQGNVTAIDTGTLDGDEKVDIAFATGICAAVSANFNGTFVSTTVLQQAGGFASDIIVRDLNFDGLSDVAYSCRDGAVYVCVNDGLDASQKPYHYTLSIGDNVVSNQEGMGTFSKTLVGMEDKMQDYLDIKPGYPDAYGNVVRGVQMNITSEYAGTLRIDEMIIVYNYTAKIDFSSALISYIASQQAPENATIECSSLTSGIIDVRSIDIKFCVPPFVKITYPQNGTYYDDEILTFACEHGGNLPVSYNWSSNLSGKLSSENNFSARLSAGAHNITLRISDGRSNASDSVHLLLKVRPKIPIIVLKYNERATAGSAVRFDASSSYDPDGSELSFAWSFGDGKIAQGGKCSHAYSNAGEYRGNLTITDGQGQTNSTSFKVTIIESEQPQICPFAVLIACCVGGIASAYFIVKLIRRKE